MDTLIQAGWEELARRMPHMEPETSELLRAVYFAGASRYRVLIKAIFEFEDDDDRQDRLIALIHEVEQWSNHDTRLERFIRTRR